MNRSTVVNRNSNLPTPGALKAIAETKEKRLAPGEKEKLIRARAANVKDEFRDIWMVGSSIRELLNLHVITIDENDNGDTIFKDANAEGAVAFLAFLEKYSHFAAGGYIRLNENPVLYFDTIALAASHGEKVKLGLREIVEFANLFHHADEFEVGEDNAYAWFD